MPAKPIERAAKLNDAAWLPKRKPAPHPRAEDRTGLNLFDVVIILSVLVSIGLLFQVVIPDAIELGRGALGAAPPDLNQAAPPPSRCRSVLTFTVHSRVSRRHFQLLTPDGQVIDIHMNIIADLRSQRLRP